MSVYGSNVIVASLLFITLVVLTGHCGSAGEFVVELMSYKYPDSYIGVQDTTTNNNRPIIKRSAKPDRWNLIYPGLCGEEGTLSFQLKGTNRYWRVKSDKKLYVDPMENNAQYKKDACFLLRIVVYTLFIGFTNVQYQDDVVRLSRSSKFLQLDYFKSTGYSTYDDLYIEADASFQIVRPFCVKLQPYNIPNKYFGLNDDGAAVLKTTPTLWVLTHGLFVHNNRTQISFRSCDDATKFLHYRPKSLEIYEDTVIYSAAFRKQATFFLRRDKYFKGFGAFEAVALDYPNHYYIRHESGRLKVEKYVDTDLFRKDSSFSGTTVIRP